MKQLIVSVLRLANRIHNSINMKRKHVKKGENLTILGKIHFHGSGLIQIGNDVVICSDPNVNPSAGGYETHIFSGEGARVVIGDHVGISHASITAYSEVVIEDYVLIGSDCMITDTDFHSLDINERMKDDGDGVAVRPVWIERNVFIGARSIILKGVHIGKGSIVGAGSVVTKNIPAGEIWGGNPAVYIRKTLNEA